MAEDRPQAGFTLVEVMCALAIAAMALVFLFRGMTGSQTAAHYLEQHLGARILAEAILDDQVRETVIVPGTHSGTSGIYRWEVTVEPAGSGVARLAPRGWRLYRLAVDLQWQPRGHFQLDVVKLGK
ncbi:MAG: prepilin-type N-terminal cleavage/methylation domain-containing protein [Hyphomicrobiales bacterium]